MLCSSKLLAIVDTHRSAAAQQLCCWWWNDDAICSRLLRR